MKNTASTLTNVILTIVLLSSVLFVGVTSSQVTYDPLLDVNGDGYGGIDDIVAVAEHFGASGTPINWTQLLLDVSELQVEVDTLNAIIVSLEECVVATGSKSYNAPVTYTPGTGFVIDVSGLIPDGFMLVRVFATGRKTDLGGTTLDEPPLDLLPKVSGSYIEIRVWDAGGNEYDNWSNQRAHIDFTLFITK